MVDIFVRRPNPNVPFVLFMIYVNINTKQLKRVDKWSFDEKNVPNLSRRDRLMTFLPFPHLDPVAFSMGPVEIRWYGISYVVGILLGWLYSRHLVKRYSTKLTVNDIDDFIIWSTVGIV